GRVRLEDAAHAGRRRMLGQELPSLVAERLLIGREVEVHDHLRRRGLPGAPATSLTFAPGSYGIRARGARRRGRTTIGAIRPTRGIFVIHSKRPGVTSARELLRGGVFSHRARPIRGAFTETLIESRNRSSQPLREEFSGSGRGSHGDDASIGRGIRHTARRTAAGVTSLPYRSLWMIGAEHLISEGIRAQRRRVGRDWTGADDLLVELANEARERLVRGAGEAEAAITLAVGHRRRHPTAFVAPSGAGVDSLGTTLHDVSREAERAHHEAIRLALRVHVTDVLLPGAGREVELEADAVPFQDIAFAVGDTVVDEAAGGGAERVSLVLANHEGGLRLEGGTPVERDGRYCGEQLSSYHCGQGCDKRAGDPHLVYQPFCSGALRSTSRHIA